MLNEVYLSQVVANQRNVVKVSLYNSGERAAFVKAICYSGRTTGYSRVSYRRVPLATVESPVDVFPWLQ